MLLLQVGGGGWPLGKKQLLLHLLQVGGGGWPLGKKQLVDQITLGQEFVISVYEKRYENRRCPKKKRGDNEIFTKEENVNEHRGYTINYN
jgi:hypothetical protein